MHVVNVLFHVTKLQKLLVTNLTLIWMMIAMTAHV